MTSKYIEDKGLAWAFREDAAKKLKTGKSVIINLDDKYNQGTHWVTAKIINNILYYADPFGTSLGGFPPEEIRITPLFVANRIAFQRPESTLCGYYAICFAFALNCAELAGGVGSQKDFEDLLMKSIL